MKHTLQITLLLILLFFAAQMIGLFIINHYIQQPDLPYNIERPKFEESTSYVPIIISIIFATLLALILVKFKAVKLWKLWFFIGVFITLLIAFGAFLNDFFAFIAALVVALLKILKRNIILHNLSELFIYSGLAGVFVPILNIVSITILLVLISIYDAIAVWKTKHMISLANFQSKSKLFAGFHIPYGKKKEAILGGGDIGFPLMFLGVVLKNYGFIFAFINAIVLTFALAFLLFFSKKNTFYPAMLYLTIGCFIGFLINFLI